MRTKLLRVPAILAALRSESSACPALSASALLVIARQRAGVRLSPPDFYRRRTTPGKTASIAATANADTAAHLASQLARCAQ